MRQRLLGLQHSLPKAERRPEGKMPIDGVCRKLHRKRRQRYKESRTRNKIAKVRKSAGVVRTCVGDGGC